MAGLEKFYDAGLNGGGGQHNITDRKKNSAWRIIDGPSAAKAIANPFYRSTKFSTVPFDE